jgi:UDP:flavonoid glycosyltransferase YjiC (YdhE family)
MNRARFVFESVGTRGNIEPFLLVAAQLRAVGHECTLIAPRAFRAEAEALGLSFYASTERREVTSGVENIQISDFFYPGYDAVVAAMRDLEKSELPIIVINIDRSCSSNLVAEKMGWPTLRLTLCPFKVRSLVAPPWPWGEHASGPMGKVYLKHTYPGLVHAADHNPRLLDYINGRRRSLGLAAVSTAFHPEPHLSAEVALFPAWFAPAASDWPARIEHAGFTAGNREVELPPQVQEFLRREPEPLVFTTGTGEGNVEKFYHAARECCEQMGRAGIFLSCLAAANTAGSARLLAVQHAELSVLLPQARAFIHHGGIGGTARAFAAGVPQVVSPIRFDQPDNARRLQGLGVAAVVPRDKLTGAALAAALHELEASRAAQEAIRRVRDLAQQPCGAEYCARVLLEQVLPAAVRSRVRPLVPVTTGAPALASPESSQKTIVMIVWPEAGHIAAPLALAKQLRARGDRVIFAGLEFIRERIVTHGFEFRVLAPLNRSSRGLPTSILWSWAGETPLASALDELCGRVDALLEEARPQLVLIDSLYSLLGGLIDGRTSWAIYETDLPREADPLVPPPHLDIVPDATAHTRAELRTAWAQLLRQTARQRAAAPPEYGGWSLRSRFPDQLRRLIQAKRGQPIGLHRNAAVAPVATANRLIFCPKTFDFERSRTHNYFWGDPCIDVERAESPFDGDLLPAGKPLIYCTQGTQSDRDGAAMPVLRNVVRWIGRRPDLCMVLTCSANQRPSLSAVAPPNCIIVERAPQLALLRRASAAIVHGGFNTVKECVAYGVPMLAVPLSHDQPRNAALVQARGVGLAAEPSQLTPAELERSMNRLLTEPTFRAAAERFRGEFEDARGSALTVIDRWIAASALCRVAPLPPSSISRGSSRQSWTSSAPIGPASLPVV